MTIIAPLRMTVTPEAAEPPRKKRFMPSYERGSHNTPVEHVYTPVMPRIAEWVNPSGVTCFWDANGFFCIPLAGKGYRILPVANPKITRTLDAYHKNKIHKARHRYKRALRRKTASTMKYRPDLMRGIAP